MAEEEPVAQHFADLFGEGESELDRLNARCDFLTRRSLDLGRKVMALEDELRSSGVEANRLHDLILRLLAPILFASIIGVSVGFERATSVWEYAAVAIGAVIAIIWFRDFARDLESSRRGSANG